MNTVEKVEIFSFSQLKGLNYHKRTNEMGLF